MNAPETKILESWKQQLLKSIEPLPQNVYDFKNIELIRIDLFSKGAVFLVFKTEKKYTHERWIPYSQLRKDINNEIWLSMWIYNKLKLKEENKFPPQETTMEIIK